MCFGLKLLRLGNFIDAVQRHRVHDLRSSLLLAELKPRLEILYGSLIGVIPDLVVRLWLALVHDGLLSNLVDVPFPLLNLALVSGRGLERRRQCLLLLGLKRLEQYICTLSAAKRWQGEALTGAEVLRGD